MSPLSELFARHASDLHLFVLLLARFGGMCALAPIFGSRMIPLRVRAVFVFFVSLAVLPVARGAAPPPGADPTLLPILFEAALGLSIGLVANLLFAGVQLGGQLAGIQMGLGLSNLVDPQTQTRITSLAQWQNLIALLLFLSLDGHHVLLEVVAASLRVLPPGLEAIAPGGIGEVVTSASRIFVLGLRIACPVLILVLMVNGAMGALTKAIPQLNVMVVGFGLNVAAGFFVLVAAQPFVVHYLEGLFAGLAGQLDRVVSGFAGGAV